MEFLQKKTAENEIIHFTVGALIKQEGKILLIDRAIEPKGFACPAGHIEEGETPEEALKREVKEETGCKIISYEKIAEEIIYNNHCSKGAKHHHWFVYACKIKGKLRRNEEAKSMGWYSKDELKSLELEESWAYWLKKLNFLN